jgi:hypothetical protein
MNSKSRPVSVCSTIKIFVNPIKKLTNNVPAVPKEVTPIIRQCFSTRHYSTTNCRSHRFPAGFLRHIQPDIRPNNPSLSKITILGKKMCASTRIKLSKSPLLCIKAMARQSQYKGRRNILCHVKTEYKHEADPDYLGTIATMYNFRESTQN